LVLEVLRGFPEIPAAMVQAVHSRLPFQLAAAAVLVHLQTVEAAAVAVVVAHTTLAAQVQADKETLEAAAQR
jgi:hypothetical protein